MSTWAGLRAELLHNDGAIPTLLDCVEESEARDVGNILSVSYLCLFLVTNRTKGDVRTVECGDVHRGGNGEEETTQTVLRELRKQKEDRGCEAQFSKDLQFLLFGQLCLAAF